MVPPPSSEKGVSLKGYEFSLRNFGTPVVAFLLELEHPCNKLQSIHVLLDPLSGHIQEFSDLANQGGDKYNTLVILWHYVDATMCAVCVLTKHCLYRGVLGIAYLIGRLGEGTLHSPVIVVVLSLQRWRVLLR